MQKKKSYVILHSSSSYFHEDFLVFNFVTENHGDLCPNLVIRKFWLFTMYIVPSSQDSYMHVQKTHNGKN